MSKKHKNVCRVLNYIDHSLITSFFSWYSYRNYEFCNWNKNVCVITSGIKKYKSINKKNKRNMIK